MANYKGVAVGTAVNWFILVLMGLFSAPLFDGPLKEYVFLIFMTINILATAIYYCFLKETKDLSEAKVAQLYVRKGKGIEKVLPIEVELQKQ